MSAGTTISASHESRLTLLETVASLQSKLQDARDEAHELRRDGQMKIDELAGQLEIERQRVEAWKRRHNEASRFAGWLLVLVALAVAAGILYWMVAR